MATMENINQMNGLNRWRGRIRSALRFLLGDQGGPVLELALISPIFAVMLVVAAEGGRVAYYAIEVSNAARGGVAYGAQSTATSTNTAAIQAAAAKDAPNLTKLSTLTVTPVLACQCANGTSYATVSCGSTSTTCASPKRVVKYVEVTTSATVNSLFNYPGLPRSYTVQGNAVMRVQ